jgi:hypothetical protein
MITIRLPFRRFPKAKICHQWLASRPRLVDAPKLAVYYDCTNTGPQAGFVRLAKRSLVVNVAPGAEAILSACKSRSRNDIRRTEREGVASEIERDMGHFLRFYADFATTKGLSPLDARHLGCYWDHLTVTKVVDQGRTITMHAWIVDEKSRRATLLHSCSQFRVAETSAERNAEGRINRFLYWDDFRRFAGLGISSADFGCYGDVSCLVEVNRFKSHFPVVETPCSTYVSWPMWTLSRLAGNVPG